MDAVSFVNSLPYALSKSERQLAADAYNSGQLPPYNEPSCRGTVSNFDVGAALKNTAITLVLGQVPFVGQFIDSIFAGITGHHAAAVRLEQATLCQAVPLATAFLQGIDQLVYTGQLDPQTAARALDQGFANWRPRVQNILKDTGGKCNAACAYEAYFLAAIAGRKARYLGVQGGTVSADSIPASVPVSGGAPGAAAVLAQAGLTPSSQSRLAGFVLIGGGVLAGVVLVSILRGGR